MISKIDFDTMQKLQKLAFGMKTDQDLSDRISYLLFGEGNGDKVDELADVITKVAQDGLEQPPKKVVCVGAPPPRKILCVSSSDPCDFKEGIEYEVIDEPSRGCLTIQDDKQHERLVVKSCYARGIYNSLHDIDTYFKIV